MTDRNYRNRAPEGAGGGFRLRDTIGSPSLNTTNTVYSSIPRGSSFTSTRTAPNISTDTPGPTSASVPRTPFAGRVGESPTTPASRRAVIQRSFTEYLNRSPTKVSQPPTPSAEGRIKSASFSTLRSNGNNQNIFDEGVGSSSDILPRALFRPQLSVTDTRTPKQRQLVRNESSSEFETLFMDTDTDTPSTSTSGWSIPSTRSFLSRSSSHESRVESPQAERGRSPIVNRNLVGSGATPTANGTAPALTQLLSSPLGVDLEPFIVAHDAKVQLLLDRAEIAWGVQYEIARGIINGLWTWSDVGLKIAQLQGTNEKIAPKVRSILLNRSVKAYDPAIWQELDREQYAIMENRDRGLGLMGPWHNEQDWYGGRIQQLARLVTNGKTCKLTLEPMEKRRSHRLARYLGSRRVLQVHVPEKQNEQAKAFLLQKFILCGRVFVPFYSKGNSAYLVEVDENYERGLARWCGDQYRKSFKEIIRWHNPLGLNANQPMSKWSSRFALALSNSVPILELKEENIFFVKDICAPSDGKPSADEIHTDGCGFINEAGLKIITRALNCPGRPTAIQGRIMGSKGLWILHPSDKESEPRLWIRDSQRKVIHQTPVHRSHLVLDLVSISRPSMSASLSTQTILNLSENGVPYHTLEELLMKGLTDEVEPLMNWDGPKAMEVLFTVINSLGGVQRARLQRVIAGLGRVLGLQRREWREEDVGGEESEDELSRADEDSPFTGRNDYSGAPLALHELSMELLQAGFHPKTSDFLKDKLRYIVKTTIDSMVEKFSIPLPESLSCFIVPDPIGILKPGEVYYRSSQPLMDPATQTYFNVVTGDVLIGRYPVYLPSDIQKVKMVDYPELFNYPDVLVVSTKGPMSFASVLSGGDYDGDDVFIIREKSLVEPFQSKPLVQAPPNFVEDNFERDIERVEQFASRVIVMNPSETQVALQRVLLLSLEETKFGLYSAFHNYSAWMYGYADQRSVRLAYMFNTLLDAGKSGLHLKQSVFREDQGLYHSDVRDTEWGSSEKPYIFNNLRKAGKNASLQLLCKFDELPRNPVSDVRGEIDVLEWSYEQARRACETIDVLWGELQAIKSVVDRSYQSWKDGSRYLATRTPSEPKTKKRKQTRLREPSVRMEACRLYQEEIPNIVVFQNVKEIKASYAYSRDPKFAFGVAFRDICTIKANSVAGGVMPSIRSFDEAKSIASSYVRALARLPMDEA